MSIKGRVNCADWTVTCNAERTSDGIVCTVSVEHPNVEGGRFVHRFKHAGEFESEREAVLAGLREGMAWINLKSDNVISV